jgi:LemA protein
MNLFALLAFLFVALGAGVYVVTIFNGLIELGNDVDKAAANIDILLKQRHDELPNLLAVSKGYMEHERDTLAQITVARGQFQAASSIDQKALADQNMAGALRQFFGIAEGYPELQADRTFLALAKRITELESQIADRREFYNDSVNTYNIRRAQMPDTFVASFMNLKPRTLFEVGPADKVRAAMSFEASAG